MSKVWDMLIFQDFPFEIGSLDSLGVGDVDGDGSQEVIAGGRTLLLWFRPATFEHGVIAHGHFQVGLAVEDVDLDGQLEVVVGETAPKTQQWAITWYKVNGDIRQPWKRFVIEPEFKGGPHDIIFADMDGDGQREMLSIACYTKTPGLFIFKPGSDRTAPWNRYAVQEGYFTEGLSVGDLDSDGKPEIVCGPDWYKMPAAGPYSGHWQRRIYAPNFREMCRTALVDITGNGRPDIVITDSEYMDGFVSWFENRLLEDPAHPWIEHRLEDGVLYSHSLDVHQDAQGRTHVFVAEMEQGGWNAPYNLDAREMLYVTSDHGRTWQREIISQGEGTHEAMMTDIDGDGELEIVGKTWGSYWHNPKIQIWKQKAQPALKVQFEHRFLDRDKPDLTVEIFGADIDRDGRQDVVCGPWWYKNPTWERRPIPGIYQALTAYDLDGDGGVELIAIKRNPQYPDDAYKGLWSDLWWIKPIDPLNGKWEEHPIGMGSGDWPHGAVVAPVLPGGKLALMTAYHDASKQEIFHVPDDPTQSPWPRRTLAEVRYSEELVPYDLDHDGKLDIIAGQFWFENKGDGTFETHVIAENYYTARLGLADLNGDGRVDLVLGQEVMDYPNKIIPFSSLKWFEQPEDPRTSPWVAHTMDSVRCAHSVSVGDIDGDGEPEVIVGEHDPFWPYRKRCRAFVYKKAEPKGRAWYRYLIDSRFEHHVGTKLLDLGEGKLGIISHAWQDRLYVHLWTVKPL